MEESKSIKILPNNDILMNLHAKFRDLKMVADFSELAS